MIQFLARLVPRRFRSDIPVVPVVRFSGVIGVVTPLRPGVLLRRLPGRNGVTTPMTPLNRTTGTMGISLRKRRSTAAGERN